MLEIISGVSRETPKVFNPVEPKKGELEELVGKTICNHQKYAISFKKDLNGSIISDIEKDGLQYQNIQLIVAKNFTWNSAKLNNPFVLTFDSKCKLLVLSDYGLRGGAGLDELVALSDTKLAITICDRLPNGVYQTLNVRTIDYDFSGMGQLKRARHIAFTVTKVQTCVGFLNAIFIGLGLGDQTKFAETNKTKLKDQLLKTICSEESEVDELVKAYAQCTEIDLYISQDTKDIEMRLRQKQVVLATYKITKFLSKLLPLLTQIKIEV